MIPTSKELNILITELLSTNNYKEVIQSLVESICFSESSKSLIEGFLGQYYFAMFNEQTNRPDITLRRLMVSCMATGLILGSMSSKKETVQ